MSLRSRALWSVIVAVALVVSYGGWLDQRGAAHLDAALERALVSFALARTLNGVISVVQETQVALQPAGIGVTLMPGELLEPINDLVERFSWVMLASSAAIGVERVLLTMSGWWGVSATMAVVVALWLGAVWLDAVPARWQRAASRLLLALVFVRFAMPVLLIVTQLVSATFLDAQATQAAAALRVTSEEARALGGEADERAQAGDGSSMLERFSASVKGLDVERRVRALRDGLSHAVEHIIDLIVVFALETVLVPLALLWLLGRLLSAALASAWRPPTRDPHGVS